MLQECKFDKNRDIRETRPGLSTDIDSAMSTGAIVDMGIVDEYNGFMDTEQIGSIVRNVFDEIDAIRAGAMEAGIEMPGFMPVEVQPDKGDKS